MRLRLHVYNSEASYADPNDPIRSDDRVTTSKTSVGQMMRAPEAAAAGAESIDFLRWF